MILDEIAEKARVRVAESKKRISPDAGTRNSPEHQMYYKKTHPVVRAPYLRSSYAYKKCPNCQSPGYRSNTLLHQDFLEYSELRWDRNPRSSPSLPRRFPH